MLPQGVHLRPARAEDEQPIRELIHRVGINPLGLDWRHFLLAVDENDRLIASGQIKPHRDGSLELASIAVVPERQRQGLGSLIVQRLIELHAPSGEPLYLTCRDALGPYYTRFGFRILDHSEMSPYFRRLDRFARLALRLHPSLGRMLVMRRTP